MNERPQICRRCRKLIGLERVCPYCGADNGGAAKAVTWMQRHPALQEWTATKIIMALIALIFALSFLVTFLFAGPSAAISSIMKPVDGVMKLMGVHYFALDKRAWWGHFTSIFLHYGIIHAAFNLYALYALGNLMEPVVKRAGLWVVFVFSGAAGALLTGFLGHVAAGASGGVFGLIGLGIVVSFFMGGGFQDPLFRSLVFWGGFNFLFGLMSGLPIDNSGHFGGLLAGFAFGFYFVQTRRQTWSPKVMNLLAAVAVVAIVLAYADLIWTNWLGN